MITFKKQRKVGMFIFYRDYRREGFILKPRTIYWYFRCYLNYFIAFSEYLIIKPYLRFCNKLCIDLRGMLIEYINTEEYLERISRVMQVKDMPFDPFCKIIDLLRNRRNKLMIKKRKKDENTRRRKIY